MVFNKILPTITKPNVVISFLQSHLPKVWIGSNECSYGGKLSTVEPCPKVPIHTHVNTQSITEKFMLKCFALFNPIQSYHLHARQYTFCNACLTAFAMHRFQGCSIPEKFLIHLSQLSNISSSHVRWSTSMLSSINVNKYATSFAVHITSLLL